MKDLTLEEYDALDEKFTKNPPDVDPGQNRLAGGHSFRVVSLDNLSADYLTTKAIAEHTTITAIIHQWVMNAIMGQSIGSTAAVSRT